MQDNIPLEYSELELEFSASMPKRRLASFPYDAMTDGDGMLGAKSSYVSGNLFVHRNILVWEFTWKDQLNISLSWL